MYRNLNAEMARYGYGLVDIERAINKCNRTVRAKLTGESQFTIDEGFAIKNTLFPNCTLDYLFEIETKETA